MTTRYEIQWLYKGNWTADGIGDANEFDSRQEAERIMAELESEDRSNNGLWRESEGLEETQMRVVELS